MKQGNLRSQIDFVVGLFVLLAAGAAAFIALHAANISNIAGDDGYQIRIQFDNIGSLSKRASVKSSGVRVGQIQQIEYNDEEFIAEVVVIIDNRYQFPLDSFFSIASGNILGGQYIAIDPGGAEQNFKDGATVVGESAVVLEHLIGKLLSENINE